MSEKQQHVTFPDASVTDKYVKRLAFHIARVRYKSTMNYYTLNLRIP